MSCERARELIIDALVQPLTAEDEAELREHLAGCPSCTDEAAKYRQVWDDLFVATAPRPAADALERLQVAVREEGVQKESAPDRWAWLKKAASILVLVGAGVFLSWVYGTLRGPGGPPPDAGGDRYLLILTRTNEPVELADQLDRELDDWIGSIREQGTIEQFIGLEAGQAIGAPPDRYLMADDTEGLIVIRVAGPEVARRIAAASPILRYGGSVEIRALD